LPVVAGREKEMKSEGGKEAKDERAKKNESAGRRNKGVRRSAQSCLLCNRASSDLTMLFDKYSSWLRQDIPNLS